MTPVTRHSPIATLPEFLTVGEVATFLHVKTGLVYALISRGELSGVRFGKLLRVPRTALQALVDTGREDVA